MSLKNYADLSKGYAAADAGFQFEFSCASCSTKWKSPLQPYRRGRFTGLLFQIGYIFSGARGYERVTRRMAESGADGARQEALTEAQARAAAYFTECEQCHNAYCHDCYDDHAGLCRNCAANARAGGNRSGAAPSASYGGGNGAAAGGNNAPTCPNCNTANHGGRFCAECGFDMASTHKSCPQCGAMAERGARFCVDCGHGY